MTQENRLKITAVLHRFQLPLHGFLPFSAVEGHLLSCRAARRLPPGAQTVIPALFPYLFPEEEPPRRRNLSRYACVPDYHQAAGEVLAAVARELKVAFPSFLFEPFIDNSPLPEVMAAAMAGLGCVGDNGLLIHPLYGSYVFIGALVTDLPLIDEAEAVEWSILRCPGCGQCTRACPTGLPGRRKRPGGHERCLSALTQKKGTLTFEEETLIRGGGLVWGCDRCQEVCPLNRSVRRDPHSCFGGQYDPLLTFDSLENLEGRACGWRGRQVLERNLRLLPSESPRPERAAVKGPPGPDRGRSEDLC